MKKIILSLTLVAFSAGSLATAASNKICFGSTKSSDTKGAVMTATITKKNVTLKTISQSSFEYNGTYPSYGTTVKGRDGHIYLEYKGENLDYQDVIMIDEALLKSETSGLLQIRARGEGFFNYVFVCRNNDRQ